VNIIHINADTFRRDHLGIYGNPWIRTPHLDRFGARANVFENAFCGSFPTVPNRHEVLTGRYVFTYHEWAPLPPTDQVLAELLGAAGYTTMMIADTPHIFQRGFHYDRGFTAWQWIRGQENDRLHTDPRQVSLPAAPHKLREPERTVKQYLRNVARRHSESDYFVAQTMRTAAEWLERNYREGPFFLYVDTFDPHEPWDPPAAYVAPYDPDYVGEEVIYPVYGYWQDFLTERELRHCHALYCGEVSLVDTWIGHLLTAIEDLGLWETTAVIFTSDHGFYFGEHGIIGKSIIQPGYGSIPFPLHEEVTRIPLLIHVPGIPGGRRIGAFVQPVDLLPTYLELAGVACPATVHGQSLLPLLRGERAALREFAVSSHAINRPVPGRPSTITTERWSFIYGAPGTATPEVRTEAVDSLNRPELAAEITRTPQLYDRLNDPGHTRNVIADYPEVARSLHQQYLRLLEAVGTAPENIAPRRHLPL
jgi:arylsulfatase A-like enzyme